MGADYGRNRDRDGAPTKAFEPNLFVWVTVMSRPPADRAIVDVGLKALAFDSGSPLVCDEPAATYQRASEEHARLTAAEGVREGVLAGLGFAIASEWMFAPELKSGVVVSVLDDWSLPPVDLWAVFPIGRRANAKASVRADGCATPCARRARRRHWSHWRGPDQAG
jgi:DNA-binding transcriptional LysR family regulator